VADHQGGKHQSGMKRRVVGVTSARIVPAAKVAAFALLQDQLGDCGNIGGFGNGWWHVHDGSPHPAIRFYSRLISAHCAGLMSLFRNIQPIDNTKSVCKGRRRTLEGDGVAHAVGAPLFNSGSDHSTRRPVRSGCTLRDHFVRGNDNVCGIARPSAFAA
jgi:hypothetical protein